LAVGAQVRPESGPEEGISVDGCRSSSCFDSIAELLLESVSTTNAPARTGVRSAR
jgi:hypothetical protein